MVFRGQLYQGFKRKQVMENLVSLVGTWLLKRCHLLGVLMKELLMCPMWIISD
ncbi:hypothetical protein CsSME_00004395 [Camellia sinensis var. sinensis]